MSRRMPGPNPLSSGRISAIILSVWMGVLHGGEVVAEPAEEAQQILEATGAKGGLIVHVGCGDGRLTAALRVSDSYLVHGLDADAANVKKAREHIFSLDLYGKMSVEQWRGARLPYIDNLVNLLVSENLGQVSMDEVLRILAPNGVAYIRQNGQWTKTVKPRPKEIDEWTHCLHSADNNAVARDAVVGPPQHIQWVAGPRRSRHHERLASVSVAVSAGGRVFSIQDEGPTASVLLPPKWFLVARDAFNGLMLWKRPLDPWEGHLKGFRSGPPALSRRLVAVKERAYVTLGYGKPLCALDPTTGKTVKTYAGTDGTTEILHHGGILFLVVGDMDAAKAASTAKRRSASPPTHSQNILVIRADTGDVVWEKSDADTANLMPVTLAVSGGRVFFQNSQELLCLDSKTGDELWRTARPVSLNRPTWSAPTLVAYGEVVLSADRAAPGEVEDEPKRKHRATWIDAPIGELIAFSAKTGERLWACPCREGFHASVDVLVTDGLVWTGEVAAAADPGITVGRDSLTGEIKRRRKADEAFFQVGMPHHRCHRNRATEQYLILGRAGVEFIELASGQGIANHWIRGTCQFGVLPCNGLLYAPPHSCACYLQAKLNGFYALAPKRKPGHVMHSTPDSGRLEHGPAFAEPGRQASSASKAISWPTYRHDEARSGYTDSVVPASLRPAWRADVGGRLSSVTIADGKVFVASINEHTVYALDARDGNVVWRFTAGGRIDSPPTISRGMALFGSADGWVYCVRASDGQLAWRFRAAPETRRVVASEQLESAWPVHGSVLVQDDVVCFAAGRSSYLDGGIYLYRLDATTGKKLSQTCINSRDPRTGYQPKGVVEGFDMTGALPDVLSTDGESLYMRHLRFDRQGVGQAEGSPHLFCPTGLLDDTWWHRSYWIFGTRFYTGYRDWFRAGREVPAGRLLVFDQSSVYGFGRKPAYYYWSTPQGYHLFATSKQPEIVESPQKRERVPTWGQQQIRYDWSKELPLQARAMVLASRTLFVAGPPDVLDEEQSMNKLAEPTVNAKLAEQSAALEGKKGALLRAISAEDGTRLAEYELDCPPVWDGMAAAGGQLYLSTTDGKVMCFAGK